MKTQRMVTMIAEGKHLPDTLACGKLDFDCG